MTWPFLTLELKSTLILAMSPETCVPTSTWSTGSNEPVAEIVVLMVSVTTLELMRAPTWLVVFPSKKIDLTPRATPAKTAMTMMIFKSFFISIRKIVTLFFYYIYFDDLGARKVANFLA